MPRQGSIAADAADFLRAKGSGATLEEISDALRKVRRSPVLQHSVRSAIYQHLDDHGERLFVRLGRARYGIRK